MELLYASGLLLTGTALAITTWRKLWVGFVIIFPFTFAYGTLLASSLYLEIIPSYVFEQDTFSYFNGSSLYLVAVITTSLIISALTTQITSRAFAHRNAARPLLSQTNILLVIALELILLAHVAASGSPWLTEGVTRFQFWEERAIIKSLSIFNWLLYAIVFVLGANGAYFLYRGKKSSKALSLTALLLAAIYFISLGNKYSAIAILLFYYFIPGIISYKLRYKEKYPLTKDLIIIAPFILAGIAFLVTKQYEKFDARGLSTMEQLIERVLILQGHTYWGSFNIAVAEGGQYNQVLNELKALLFRLPDGEAGMSFLMQSLAPPAIFDSYTQSGVQFTLGFPGINIVVFGLFFGAIATLISWIIFSFFLSYLLCLIAQGSRVRLLFSAYLYLNSFVWFQRGSLDGFINWKTLTVLFMIATIEIHRHTRKLQYDSTQGLKNG